MTLTEVRKLLAANKKAKREPWSFYQIAKTLNVHRAVVSMALRPRQYGGRAKDVRAQIATMLGLED